MTRRLACGVYLVLRSDGAVYLGGTDRPTLKADLHLAPVLDEVAVLAADAAACATMPDADEQIHRLLDDHEPA